MNDLPDDLAHPRRDHHLIANIVVGIILLAILAGLVVFYLTTGGLQ
jgi:hypothetical protein